MSRFNVGDRVRYSDKFIAKMNAKPVTQAMKDRTSKVHGTVVEVNSYRITTNWSVIVRWYDGYRYAPKSEDNIVTVLV